MRFSKIFFYRLLLVITIFNSLYVVSQNPSYLVLGEKELNNADVYSILETKNGELYVATNQGLFVYIKGEFKLISPDRNQIGSSLFNLIENKKGELFCNNLNGQVFKITNKKLKLFYSLPNEKLGRMTQIAFDDQESLILSSKGLFNITNPKNIYAYDTIAIGSINKLINGKIIVNRSITGKIGCLSKGKYSLIGNKENGGVNAYRTNLLLNDNDLISDFFSLKFQNIYTKKEIATNFKLNFQDRFFQFSKNNFWILDPNKGVKQITFLNNTLQKKRHFFKENFISVITKGSNNTLYFGTFGSGIFVVPNLDLVIQRESIKKDIRSIAVSPKNRVFFTERGKGIMSLKDGKISHIKDSTKRLNYHKIFYVPKHNFKLNKKYPELLYDAPVLGNSSASYAAVKNVSIIDDETVLISSSGGLFKLGSDKFLEKISWSKKKGVNLYNNKSFKNRIAAIAFDEKNKTIYLNTNNKLLLIHNDNTIKELTYNKNSINAKSIIYYDDKIWVGTDKNGILVFKNEHFFNKITENEGLSNNQIRKIEIKDEKLFILDKRGFQYLDLKTNKIVFLGVSEGFNGYLNEFKFSDDKLWTLTDNKNINSIFINQLPKKNSISSHTIDSIHVSKQRLSIKKEMLSTFSHNQNKLTVYSSVKNSVAQLNTNIYYKISGIDTNWNIKPAKDSSPITYKSLPSGNYTFSIFTKYGNTKSKIETFSFKIKLPYWKEWWFYFFILCCLSLIGYFIVKNKFDVLKKKQQEKLEKQALETNLFETKLTALRSQMNPHFIFNALNSIQDLVLQQDTDTSYDYIVLFSKLVRNALNYSNKDFIPLEKEIDFLKIYLKLEKLRFGDSFEYLISSNVNLELETPSLLIQPFVENALVHGLLHKTGQKSITIKFNFDKNLTCTIVDNGIGRKAVSKIHERQGKSHESFALKAIEKRLDILKKQYNQEIGYSIIDLYENNLSVGTKVIIQLPYKTKF